MLDAEILDRLIDGKRTIAELVNEIYGLRRGNEGYESHCKRVRRATQSLERKGLVSTQIFGRDKPYRLTRHGVAVLASISKDVGEPRIIGRGELSVVLFALIVGSLMFAATRQGIGGVPGAFLSFIFALFFTLLGFSLGVLLRVVRRVT